MNFFRFIFIGLLVLVSLVPATAIQRTWLVHGPDLTGGYGDLQGTGGVDAVVNDATGGASTGIISDIYGHAVATVTGGYFSGATATWNTVRSTGYGPEPGTTVQPLDGVHDLSSLLNWRGKYVDGTGFYYLGARYYDPSSGTFVSPDPLGHAASMDLYSAFNGDPVNYFDPNGWCPEGVQSGGNGSADSYDLDAFEMNQVHAVLPGDYGAPTVSPFVRVIAGMFGPPDPDSAPSPKTPLGTGPGHNAALYGTSVLRSVADTMAFINNPARTGPSFSQNLISQSYQSQFTTAERSDADFAIAGLTLFSPIQKVEEVSVGLRVTEAVETSVLNESSAASLNRTLLNLGGDVSVPAGTTGIRTMLADLTASTGNEVALLRMTNGDRIIRMGTPNTVFLGSGVARVIAHTHPNGILEFSNADIDALIFRGQKSSVLIDPQDAFAVRISVENGK